jgi:hypothetical protein
VDVEELQAASYRLRVESTPSYSGIPRKPRVLALFGWAFQNLAANSFLRRAKNPIFVKTAGVWSLTLFRGVEDEDARIFDRGSLAGFWIDGNCGKSASHA